ncbi:MAG: HEAT repeat domain-containing protein [Gemmatimonas sp.]
MRAQTVFSTQRMAAAIAITMASAGSVQAQGLAQRIANAPDGRVQFNYPARDGSCGDGRTYMRLNYGTSNEFYGNMNSNNTPDCTKGPARVVLEIAARTVIGIRAFVGPVEKQEGVTELGAVTAKEASDYLLGLAAKAEGSVSGNAILPAMIADGVDNQAALLGIARDQSRARETRRSAISYLSRDGRTPAGASQPLLAIATDETDNQSVRQQALRTLSRLEGGAGIPELIRLASDRQGNWVAREALTSLAQSGDPRSREFLRGVVRRGELPDEAMATAVRSLGTSYATGADVALIRESWLKLPGNRSQDAALSAITEFGGAENAKWLLNLAKDPGISPNNQRRALSNAVRAGARVSEIIAMYNVAVDYQMKEAIISALAPNDDRESLDKLLAIAKSDESVTARKRAVSALGRSTDPRVRKELEALIDKPATGRY